MTSAGAILRATGIAPLATCHARTRCTCALTGPGTCTGGSNAGSTHSRCGPDTWRTDTWRDSDSGRTDSWRVHVRRNTHTRRTHTRSGHHTYTGCTPNNRSRDTPHGQARSVAIDNRVSRLRAQRKTHTGQHSG